jgi:membrane-bound metal-dependent hydrolase YbcI (DUF457 family)
MDPITHGITGTLLGKSFFSKRQAQVGIVSATLGAVFPDVDVFMEVVTRDPMGIVRYHRNITHSFVCLPFFAAALAWLTRRVARWLGFDAPSWRMLTLIYAVGIASHIVLDGMTSFGTRLWAPISAQRVAWDVLFIIDFSLTAIVLLPQVVAWVYRRTERSRLKAIAMWILFSAAGFGVWSVAGSAGYRFRLWIAAAFAVFAAGLFFLPGIKSWGFRVSRANWCRAGLFVALVYVFFCVLAHHAALRRVKEFAAVNHVPIVRIAAIPVPPSMLDWGGEIRTPDGVYQAHFDLRESGAPSFLFFADSPSDQFITRALQLRDVRLYWEFARFPVIRSFPQGVRHIVEFSEHRFVNRVTDNPPPFTYRVVFDNDGNLVAQGWYSNGLQVRSMREFRRARGGPSSK